MNRPNNLQSITYTWSNTEGLVGDDITFLVCRALVKLPSNRQEVEKIVAVSGKNVINGISWAGNPKEVIGKLLVDLDLQLSEANKKTRFIKLELPYRALVKSSRLGELNPEVKFIHAKKVDADSLLVEGIISLTSLGYLPWRGEMGIKGEFSDSCTLKIDKLLPEVQEMISAQVRFMPFSHSIEEDVLTLKGWKEIYLMYIAEKSSGEKVIVTRQVEPFTKKIILNNNLRSLDYLEINNGDIRSHVRAAREIIVEGNFKLTAHEAPFMPVMKSTDNLLEKVREMAKKVQDKKKAKEEKTAQPIVKEKVEVLPEEKRSISPKEEIEEEPATSFEDVAEKGIDTFPEVVADIISAPPEIVLEEESSVSTKVVFEEIIPEEVIPVEEKEIPVNEPSTQLKETPNISVIENNDESVVIPRESKRAKLSKHMRNLKSI